MSPTKVIKLKAMQRQILEIPSKVWNGNSRENKKVKKNIYETNSSNNLIMSRLLPSSSYFT